MSVWKKYAYLWITLILFLGSLIGHWSFGWSAYVSDQQAHGEPIEFGGYVVEMMRDTLENWQSEFLQLMWQVCGLAFFLFVGSPQSKEEDDRMEEKIDQILKAVKPDEADKLIQQIDKRFPGREVGPKL
jgi:hypothetical protein